MKYIIYDISEINNIDLREVPYHTKENIRRSLNGLKFIIKYYTEPSFVTDEDIVYTKEQILDIVLGSEWTEEDIDI